MIWLGLGLGLGLELASGFFRPPKGEIRITHRPGFTKILLGFYKDSTMILRGGEASRGLLGGPRTS